MKVIHSDTVLYKVWRRGTVAVVVNVRQCRLPSLDTGSDVVAGLDSTGTCKEGAADGVLAEPVVWWLSVGSIGG